MSPVTGPFENRNFRVGWDGRYIPGISKIYALQWSTDVVTIRDGLSNTEQSGPGRMKYGPLTLERPASFDLSFENWAQQVIGNQPVNDTIYKNVRIEIHDAAGSTVIVYNLLRCWPTTYEPFTVLDGNGDIMVIERLVLEYATFERDASIAAPTT